MRDLYVKCVGECGISPTYFLDSMTLNEVFLYLKGYECKKRDSWERCRSIAYIIAQVNSSARLSPSDVMSFSWDVADNDSESAAADEDISALWERAKRIEKEYQKR